MGIELMGAFTFWLSGTKAALRICVPDSVLTCLSALGYMPRSGIATSCGNSVPRWPPHPVSLPAAVCGGAFLDSLTSTRPDVFEPSCPGGWQVALHFRARMSLRASVAHHLGVYWLSVSSGRNVCWDPLFVRSFSEQESTPVRSGPCSTTLASPRSRAHVHLPSSGRSPDVTRTPDMGQPQERHFLPACHRLDNVLSLFFFLP